MVVYFDFFGTRFFGLSPDRPDGSASSPWHGQASLNASRARVMPGTSNRSGCWSRYNRTLALYLAPVCGIPANSAEPSTVNEKTIADLPRTGFQSQIFQHIPTFVASRPY